MSPAPRDPCTQHAPPPRGARRRRRSQRGVALVMVLATITILTVLLTDFQDEASSELSATVTDRDALKAEYLARSGINLSRLLIASEPTIRAAISPLFMMMGVRNPPQIPVWEFTDRILGAFNDKQGHEEFSLLAGVDLSQGRNLGVDEGRFELVIIDEDSKINMNIAARGDAFSQQRIAAQLLGLVVGDEYNPLFEERDLDDQFTDRLVLCSALIDWADPDNDAFNCDPRTSVVASSAGAEDSFYQLLKQPYRRKNAAFDSLEELRLVRGMGDDVWATFIDPEPGDPRKRVATVWGQGAVNVNTANAQTLLTIICAGAVLETKLCYDPAQAGMFLTMVGSLGGYTAGAPLFSSPKDFIRTMGGGGLIGPLLAAMQIEPVKFKSNSEMEKAISVESKVFSIYADGVVPGYRRETRVRIHTVVDFRAAPAPGIGAFNLGGLSLGGGDSSGKLSPGGLDPGGSGKDEGGQQMSENAIAGALVPNPGGSIIYFRFQ